MDCWQPISPRGLCPSFLCDFTAGVLTEPACRACCTRLPLRKHRHANEVSLSSSGGEERKRATNDQHHPADLPQTKHEPNSALNASFGRRPAWCVPAPQRHVSGVLMDAGLSRALLFVRLPATPLRKKTKLESRLLRAIGRRGFSYASSAFRCPCSSGVRVVVLRSFVLVSRGGSRSSGGGSFSAAGSVSHSCAAPSPEAGYPKLCAYT